MKTKISNAEYHALYKDFPYFGSSQIKLAKNLAKFKAQVIDGKFEREEKRSFDLGSSAHSVNLEGDHSKYIVGPDLNKNTNAWKDFVKAHEGKIILDSIQHAQLLGMAKAFANHAKALDLRAKSEIETTILWADDETGLQCKARPDGFYELPRSIVAWDYKTARSADKDSFSRAMLDYGYDLSAAHYASALKAETGKDLQEFLFVVQETCAPYLIKVYRVSVNALARGFNERSRLLNTISVAMETNDWPGYGNAVEEIDLPEFAYIKDQRMEIA